MFRPVRSALALLVATVASLFSLATVAVPARADPPFRLDRQVVDRAGVLDEAQVQPALDDLRRDTGVQLFVVFVESFDGTPASQWADRTASISGLGKDY